jgi:hypothetical protein
VGRISLVGEQAAHIHIAALGQGGPHHLIPQAGDPHCVGAGEGQHGPQGPGLGHDGLEQQGFVVQVYSARPRVLCSLNLADQPQLDFGRNSLPGLDRPTWYIKIAGHGWYFFADTGR